MSSTSSSDSDALTQDDANINNNATTLDFVFAEDKPPEVIHSKLGTFYYNGIGYDMVDMRNFPDKWCYVCKDLLNPHNYTNCDECKSKIHYCCSEMVDYGGPMQLCDNCVDKFNKQQRLFMQWAKGIETAPFLTSKQKKDKEENKKPDQVD